MGRTRSGSLTEELAENWPVVPGISQIPSVGLRGRKNYRAGGASFDAFGNGDFRTEQVVERDQS
jgi:hypothetical protein